MIQRLAQFSVISGVAWVRAAALGAALVLLAGDIRLLHDTFALHGRTLRQQQFGELVQLVVVSAAEQLAVFADKVGSRTH